MDATQRCVVTPSRGLLDEGDVSAGDEGDAAEADEDGGGGDEKYEINLMAGTSEDWDY